MAEENKEKEIPSYVGYSIAVRSLRSTEQFPNKPNPDWHKKRILASGKDITKLFSKLQEEIGGEITGPVSFTPKEPEGVKVYFDPKDSQSLYIVVETEEIGDDYAKANKFTKPFNAPRRYRQDFANWQGSHRQLY